MAELTIQKLITTILIVSGLITGVYVFLGDMAGEEGFDVDVTQDSDYQNKYNRTKEVNDQLSSSYESLVNLPTDVLAAFFTGVKEVFNIVTTLIVTPFKLLGDLWGLVSINLGIPGWITGLITGLLAISILFGLAAVIIKYRA